MIVGSEADNRQSATLRFLLQGRYLFCFLLCPGVCIVDSLHRWQSVNLRHRAHPGPVSYEAKPWPPGCGWSSLDRSYPRLPSIGTTILDTGIAHRRQGVSPVRLAGCPCARMSFRDCAACCGALTAISTGYESRLEFSVREKVGNYSALLLECFIHLFENQPNATYRCYFRILLQQHV